MKYSDKDLKRGGEEHGLFGVTINFKNDFRRKVLAIKKLVRLKYQINDPQFSSKIDEILDMIEKI